MNTLVRAGYNISLANPVALYIMDVRTAGWTLQGKDASKYMKLVRGTKGAPYVSRLFEDSRQL